MKNLLLMAILLLGYANNGWSQCPPSTTPGVHVVQSQENLYRISQAYNVSMGELCKWNGISMTDVLPVCTELKISAPIKKVAPQASTPIIYETEFDSKGSSASYKKQGKRHVVQQGETMAGLAELYGFTVNKFRKINAMDKDDRTLTPGSVLLTTECACEIVNEDVYTEKNSTTIDPFSSGKNHSSTTTVPVPHSPKKNLSSRSNDVTTSKGDNGMSSAAPYMKNVEYTMIEEINLLRGNPSGYIQHIESYRRQKKNAGQSVPDATIDELITELRNTPKLSILEPSECIYRAAKNHGNDILRRGKSGHQGTNGSWPWERVKKTCPDFQDGNENLVGGPATVRESVTILLIDHGISSRGHRKTLLNPHWTHAGSYKIGQVGMMPNSWVQKFGQMGDTSSKGSSTTSTKPEIQQPKRFSPKKYKQKKAKEAANMNKAPEKVASASFMKPVENDMMHEINLMRSNPAAYVKYVEEYRAAKKKLGYYPVPEATINELVAELKRTPTLSTLKPSQCVYDAATGHGHDILRMGKSGHQGTDGSWPWDRVRRACTSFKDGNENLVGGPDNVRESVIILLIDDGISSRGHRKTLLNPKWTHVACYKIGQVGQMPNCWVQQFGQE